MPGGRRHRFEVLYTESMLRDAVRAYVFRRFVVEQKRLWLLCGLMIVLAFYFAWKGQPPWTIALAASGAIMAPAIAALGWWVHLSNTLEALRRMPAPRASIGFRDDAMELSSEAGKGELPWSSLTEIWERPGYWMFFTGRNRFNVLPMANVPEEARAWFRGRNRAILKKA
ncbi:YcxB family protein [Enterovirga sp.]|uniref:YcxB family protein n=1 Tax=Enterovirga sp. TaxID=2026350 RepID=UPI002C43AF75|nr:YcxB family protein [Enterovirga sp.]HMO30518.1 YcxB family protein [Enterovirga sp.]